MYNHSGMHSDGGWTETFSDPLYSGTHSDLGSLGVASAGGPRHPEWVNENGIVDLAKLPKEVKVADADGNIVTDDKGNPVTVNPRLTATPPTKAPTGTAPADSYENERTIVTNEDGTTTEKVEVDMALVADTL